MNTKLIASSGSVKEMSEKLMNDLREAVSDGDHLLKKMANSSVEEVTSARSRIEASMSGARHRLDDARLLVSRKAHQAAEDGVEFVKENPWKTVGVVAVLGLIAGILLKRRD